MLQVSSVAEIECNGQKLRVLRPAVGAGPVCLAGIGFEQILTSGSRNFIYVERNGTLRLAELGPGKDFIAAGQGVGLEGADGKNKFDQAFVFLQGFGNSWARIVAKLTSHNPIDRKPGHDSMAYLAVTDWPYDRSVFPHEGGLVDTNGNLLTPSTPSGKHSLQPQGARLAVHARRGTSQIRVASFVEPSPEIRVLHLGLRDQTMSQGTTWNTYECYIEPIQQPQADQIITDDDIILP